MLRRTHRRHTIDPTLGNRLLAALPRVERQSLLAHCELVDLSAGSWLEPGRVPHDVYFPVDCAICAVIPSAGRSALEVGAVGCEGMFGPQSSEEAEWFALRGLVQGAGQAWRVDASTLQHLCTGHERLNALLVRYMHVLLVQTARGAACCRFHSLEQRLARWLLSHGDRTWSEEISITHDQLAMLLGSRRAGVTVATGELEQRGLLSGSRGRIRLTDRAGLIEVSCSCYVQDRETYERAMGVAPSLRRY